MNTEKIMVVVRVQERSNAWRRLEGARSTSHVHSLRNHLRPKLQLDRIGFVCSITHSHIVCLDTAHAGADHAGIQRQSETRTMAANLNYLNAPDKPGPDQFWWRLQRIPCRDSKQNMHSLGNSIYQMYQRHRLGRVKNSRKIAMIRL